MFARVYTYNTYIQIIHTHGLIPSSHISVSYIYQYRLVLGKSGYAIKRKNIYRCIYINFNACMDQFVLPVIFHIGDMLETGEIGEIICRRGLYKYEYK